MFAPLWTTKDLSASWLFQEAFGGHPRTVRWSEPLHISLRTRTSIYRELETLPPFSPDIDGPDVVETVTKFRATLQACDAVLISGLEYAHGVPGVLKNALDWVVGSGELIDKPIALINASARAKHARASLAETLATMSAQVIVDASITVSLDGRALDANGIVRDAELSAALSAAIHALASACETRTRSNRVRFRCTSALHR